MAGSRMGQASSSEVQWHRAQLADDQEVGALAALMQRFYEEDLGVEMTADRALGTLGELRAHPQVGTVYLARPHGAAGAPLVGYALVVRYLSNEFGGYVAFLDEFFLLPPYRGLGNGTRLLRGLETVARGQGLTALWLEVDPDNQGAQRLYHRSGFTTSQRLLMRKRLPAQAAKPLPDVIDFGLSVLFVGYNPGLRSAEIGHHFAGHSNRFWELLVRSGLTPTKYRSEEDRLLPLLGFGITNLVDRPTRAADELTTAEYEAGRASLKERIQLFRPSIVAYVGKDVYRRYAGTSQPLEWGLQPGSVCDGITDFVLPNPSGLNRMPLADQVSHYQALARLLSSR